MDLTKKFHGFQLKIILQQMFSRKTKTDRHGSCGCNIGKQTNKSQTNQHLLHYHHFAYKCTQILFVRNIEGSDSSDLPGQDSQIERQITIQRVLPQDNIMHDHGSDVMCQGCKKICRLKIGIIQPHKTMLIKLQRRDSIVCNLQD